MPAMQAVHMNAFIDATLETFQSMCGLSFKRKGKVRKVDGEIVDSEDLMAICGLSGPKMKGAIMLTTPLETGMKIVSAFLMEEINEINCDLMDGFGELVNIIAGAAEVKVSEFRYDLSLPSILVGNQTKFFAKAGRPFVMVPMHIDKMGPFNLGVSLDFSN